MEAVGQKQVFANVQALGAFPVEGCLICYFDSAPSFCITLAIELAFSDQLVAGRTAAKFIRDTKQLVEEYIIRNPSSDNAGGMWVQNTLHASLLSSWQPALGKRSQTSGSDTLIP